MLTESTSTLSSTADCSVRNRPVHDVSRDLGLDVVAGLLLIASAAAARIGIEQFVGGIAPFVLTFPAVMVATLVRGGRAGTIAAVGCQLLTIRFVFPNWVSNHGGISTDLANVALSTAALAGTVWATASYRRAAAQLRSRCEHKVHTLSLLIAEIDHRTKNNFQIAANLLAIQSISASNPDLSRELDKAASRLASIASIYQDLSLGTSSVEQINLADHIERIIGLLREGATSDKVRLTYHGDAVTCSAESAIIVGLIVNEWVTNALKHAFGDGAGSVSIDVGLRQDRIVVVVLDDGDNTALAGRPGKGMTLVNALAEVINGTMTFNRDRGTRHTLSFPDKLANGAN